MYLGRIKVVQLFQQNKSFITDIFQTKNNVTTRYSQKIRRCTNKAQLGPKILVGYSGNVTDLQGIYATDGQHKRLIGTSRPMKCLLIIMPSYA